MKRHSILFVAFICTIVPVFGAFSATSKCSKLNLQRCLDSACAINIGMNPAARCQYCGTSSAGNPPSQKGLSSVTAGQSTKFAFTAKELSVAPSDAGRRYVWATTECIKKLPDCTTDDVSATYDKLIEQSCKAAGIAVQISATMAKASKKPTKSSCNTQLSTCIEQKCGGAFERCQDDATFTRSIAECATDATGCDEYIAEFRAQATNDRTAQYQGRENELDAVVKNYQETREYELAETKSNCQTDAQFNYCVNSVCGNRMPNRCKDNETEKSMANRLCQFYKTACTAIKY